MKPGCENIAYTCPACTELTWCRNDGHWCATCQKYVCPDIARYLDYEELPVSGERRVVHTQPLVVGF